MGELPFGNYRPFDPSLPVGSCNCAYPGPYNEQCEFYHKEYHMGGYISTCLNQDIFGWCECDRCPKNMRRGDNGKDYISREAALACVCQDCSVSESCLFPCVDYCRIKDIPSADVRPVVNAEWERPKGSTPRSWIFVCSKCGDRAYFPVPKYFPKWCGYSFCPNCGADMREVKTDEKQSVDELPVV